MNRRHFFLVAVLVLLSANARAQEWAAYGTISAEPTPGRICTGDANGKDILCASPAPYVDASGNVGIGTDTVSYKLVVRGDGTSDWKNAAIIISNSGAGGRVYSLSSRSSGAFTIGDETAGVIRVVVDSSGNVGIGTATPGGTLHVYAPSTNTASNFIGLQLSGAQSTANTATYYGAYLNPTYTAADQ